MRQLEKLQDVMTYNEHRLDNEKRGFITGKFKSYVMYDESLLYGDITIQFDNDIKLLITEGPPGRFNWSIDDVPCEYQDVKKLI